MVHRQTAEAISILIPIVNVLQESSSSFLHPTLFFLPLEHLFSILSFISFLVRIGLFGREEVVRMQCLSVIQEWTQQVLRTIEKDGHLSFPSL